jgi:hypothetical protein
MNLVSSEERHLMNQVNRLRLMEWNREIAKEVRLSGSAEERRAFTYVRAELERFGYTTQWMEADAYISLPVRATLHVDGEEMPCITHSMSASVRDLHAELVDLGQPDTWPGDLRGRIGIVDGLAVPGVVLRAAERGVAGLVFVNGDLTYEMIVSPVWGSPTPETLELLPKIPVVSVTREIGERIRELVRQGRGNCTLTTVIDTGVRSIPILTADLQSPANPDDFVLFSSHIDSWHYGAMDNASANALMLEVARILASRQQDLRRSVRFAFWSGHSHGRYAASAWYCDTYWMELYDHCIAHINVDSVGGRGASVLSEANTMAETRALGAVAIAAVTGEEFRGTRFGRAGDQSFWGPGVPSLFMGLSEQPPSDEPAARAFALLFGGGRTGGFGWWWHTTEDTLDKIDPDNLVRDTQVYLLVLWRLLTELRLPIHPLAAASEIHSALRAWQEKAGQRADLTQAIQLAQSLEQVLRDLEACAAELDDPHAAEVWNRSVMRLSRLLVPLNYVRGSVFDHDLALSQPMLPKLADIDELAAAEPSTLVYLALQTRVRRRHNEVCAMLRQAVHEARACLDSLEAYSGTRRESP